MCEITCEIFYELHDEEKTSWRNLHKPKKQFNGACEVRNKHWVWTKSCAHQWQSIWAGIMTYLNWWIYLQALISVPSANCCKSQMEAWPLHVHLAPTATSAIAYQYDCNTWLSPNISSPNVLSRSSEIRRSVAVTHSWTQRKQISMFSLLHIIVFMLISKKNVAYLELLNNKDYVEGVAKWFHLWPFKQRIVGSKLGAQFCFFFKLICEATWKYFSQFLKLHFQHVLLITTNFRWAPYRKDDPV